MMTKASSSKSVTMSTAFSKIVSAVGCVALLAIANPRGVVSGSLHNTDNIMLGRSSTNLRHLMTTKAVPPGNARHLMKMMGTRKNIKFEQVAETLEKPNIDDTVEFERFGFRIDSSRDGSMVIVGTPGYSDNDIDTLGQVFVFKAAEDGSWTQVGQTFQGVVNTTEFTGFSVAMSNSGDRIAYSAIGNFTSSLGIVQVYDWNVHDEMWDLTATLEGEEDGEFLGLVISMSGAGDRMALSSEEKMSIYHESKEMMGVWELKATILGRQPDIFFAFDVSISRNGMYAATGGIRADTPPLNSTGYIQIYKYYPKKDEWIQIGEDINGESEQQLGMRVRLSPSGKRVVAVNSFFFGGPSVAEAFVYELTDGDKWVQVGQKLTSYKESSLFGWAMEINDYDRLAISAFEGGQSREEGAFNDLGRVYLYDLIDGTWELAYTIEGKQTASNFGVDISMIPSGKKIYVAEEFFVNALNVTSGAVRLYRERGEDSPIQLKFFSTDTNGVVPFANEKKIDLCNVPLDAMNQTNLSVEVIVHGEPSKVAMKLSNATTEELLFRNVEGNPPYTLGGDIDDSPMMDAFPVPELVADGMLKLFVRAEGVGRETFVFDVKPCLE